MAKNTRWTKLEETKLKDMYKESKETLCSEFKGRTWSSIVVKINRLGLKRNEWTIKEEKELKEIYPYGQWDEITKIFPSRNKKAIATKAERMGLKRKGNHKRKDSWNNEEIKKLENLYPDFNKSIILNELPKRTWLAISTKANELGIKRNNYLEIEISKDALYNKYFTENLNIRQCEEYFNCSNQTILTRLRKWFPEEFEDKLKTIGLKYSFTDIKEMVEGEGYDFIGYEGDASLVKTENHIVVSCPNINHKEYRVKINSFISGYRCRECYFQNNVGENNPAYNHDLTQEEREAHRFVSLYKKWRMSVYERDQYTCQKCGDKTGGNLVAHHLDGYNWCKEKRTDIDNGITLCEDCHKAFHQTYGYGSNTKEQLIGWHWER